MSNQIFHIICCPGFHSFGSLQTTDIYDGSEVYVTLPGIIMMTIYCTVSGLAGVFTEYILKRHYKVGFIFC